MNRILLALICSASLLLADWNGATISNWNGATISNWNGATISGGGGAAAFTFVNEDTATNDGGSVTSVTMSSSVGAGNLVLVWIKWEGSGDVTAVTENGNSLTALTQLDQAGGDLHSQMWYRLSAGGGGTSIALTWTGTVAWVRVIAQEFDYGGTASFVAEGPVGADTNPTSPVASAAVTNSGTHRLNVVGWGAYTSTALTGRTIGGSSSTPEPAAQLSDTWTFHNTVNLSSQTADGDYTSDGPWTMNLACFAAN